MNLQDIAKRHVLNDTEFSIMETIIQELHDGNERISIRELANKTYVSTTTIIKMAKKIGFVGYSQMIYVLNESIHQHVEEENCYRLSEFIADSDITIVEELANDIHLFKDKKIYLVGIGFSNMITGYFAKRLAEFDIFAYDGAPIDCITTNSTPSIVIFFSKSGETEDLIQISQMSKKMGHKIYAITTSCQSTLAKVADKHIQLEYKRNKLFDTPDYYVATGIFVVENILVEVLKHLCM